MAKWITRRDLNGEMVEPPALCVERNQTPHANGLKTVEEHIASLLEPYEIVEGRDALRKIHARGHVAGFIEVSADCPPEASRREIDSKSD